MKMKFFAAMWLPMLIGAAQADGTLVSLDLQSAYSGLVGSQSLNGTDTVNKIGTATTNGSIAGEGDCLTCGDFDVSASLSASEELSNSGESTSDQSDVQTSSVGQGAASAGTALQVGNEYSRAALGGVEYLNTTAGKFVGTSGQVDSTQSGDAGVMSTMTYTGTACPSGTCGEGGGSTYTTLSGWANTTSTTNVTAYGDGGAGALAVNGGLQAVKIQFANGQLTTTAPAQ